MSRIKIELAGEFSFQTSIPVRITDVNYGGHVGNDSILSIIHEARVQFLSNFNYNEMDVEGVSLIMSDVAIQFKSELFYGNTIRAHVKAGEFTRAGFVLYYKLVKQDSNTVIAIATTGMVCFDYSKKKITAVPEKAKQRLLS
ncbi:MAG: acyl-CoA thioesterase [Candidatus Dadabacteria bacterium]